ncbi:MAG TPA: hypothetical protein VJU83_04030 [Burkholderiales bacterium]|nr:hypothetical protein [Burkholderiales bacterium]
MRLSLLCFLIGFHCFAVAQSPAGLPAVSAQTCGKLFGAKQTAMRLRAGGFSEKQTLEETLNRPEWHDATRDEVVWAVRIVDEVYAQPEQETSQVVRECRAKAQGLNTPEPLQLPADLK